MTSAEQVSTHPEPTGPTPSQTIGPFFRFGLDWMGAEDLVAPDAPGALRLTGRILDGDGAAVPDAMVEVWQADADGSLDGRAGWSGFGRCLTDGDGRYRFTTVAPGTVDGHQAPHIDMTIFARGLLQRLVTRVYLPDHPANGSDPVLAALDDRDRATLIAGGAGAVGTAVLEFDVRLRGERETVFFAW